MFISAHEFEAEQATLRQAIMRQSKPEFVFERCEHALLYGLQQMVALTKLARFLCIRYIRKLIWFAKYQRETSNWKPSNHKSQTQRNKTKEHAKARRTKLTFGLLDLRP